MSNGTKEPQRSRNRNRGNRNRNRSRNGSNESSTPRNSSPSNRPPSQHQQFVKKATQKLTFWQKLLKMIGLYREPKTATTRPQVGTRRGDDSKTSAAPKNNVRGSRGSSHESREETGAADRSGRAPRDKRPPVSGDVESTRLYIGNLSYDASEHDIEDLFKGVGPVRSVEVVYNKHTHKSKGYGFVEMLHIDEAKRAVEILHDQPFMGRKLIVSGAKAKNIEDEHASRQATAPPRTERPERQERPAAANKVAAAATPVAVTAAPVTSNSEPAVERNAVIEEVTSLATAEILNPTSAATESTSIAAIVSEATPEKSAASSDPAISEPVATVVTTTETSVTQVEMAQVTDVFIPPAPVTAEPSTPVNAETSAPAAIVINEVIESVASAPITIEIPSSFAAPVAEACVEPQTCAIPNSENMSESSSAPVTESAPTCDSHAAVASSELAESPKADQP